MRQHQIKVGKPDDQKCLGFAAQKMQAAERVLLVVKRMQELAEGVPAKGQKVQKGNYVQLEVEAVYSTIM